MQDVFAQSLERHRETRGKIEIRSRMRLESQLDLSLAYTPGVARPCEEIAANPGAAWDLTWKGRTVAVVSDGSAILGLGDLGPAASLPVMEGKAALFHEFAGVDAVPVVLDAHAVEDIVAIVKAIAPTFGGINLEDISAPRCFAIEEALQDIGIPVLHDDQHGTAIVLLAALTNATRVLGRTLSDLSIVINGAGAAGRAIARLLTCTDDDDRCVPVKQIRICDSKGIVWPGRPGNDALKEELGELTNPDRMQGSLRDALEGADAFIGVSRGNLLDADDVRRMAPESGGAGDGEPDARDPPGRGAPGRRGHRGHGAQRLSEPGQQRAGLPRPVPRRPGGARHALHERDEVRRRRGDRGRRADADGRADPARGLRPLGGRRRGERGRRGGPALGRLPGRLRRQLRSERLPERSAPVTRREAVVSRAAPWGTAGGARPPARITGGLPAPAR